MKIGGKLLSFVGACSLTTLVVAGVSVATLKSFERSLTSVESASIRALDAANFNRLAAEVTMDSRGVYASADRAEAATAARLFPGAKLAASPDPGVRVTVGQEYADAPSPGPSPKPSKAPGEDARSAADDICSDLSYG